jgi:putative FmdB family regulatory protein
MPLYEYQCVQCGERVEIIQRLSDPPHTECAKCGGEMKKLMSAPAIQFKGSGWYKTDYAAKPAAASTSSDSSSRSEATSETKSESKTETKSETKAETKSEAKTSE